MAEKKKRKLFTRMLDKVEVIGNALPHPATIFGLLAFGVVIASAISASLGVTAVHPGTGEAIAVNTRRTDDRDDVYTDYHGGRFHYTLKSAMEHFTS